MAIVDERSTTLNLVYFNLLRLNLGEEWQGLLRGYEAVFVVLTGNCEIFVDGERFPDVGKRKDIWSGEADSVYAGTALPVKIRGNQDKTEIAVAGGRCDRPFKPFRILPEDVDMVDVGSTETHSRRRIYHILGNRQADKAGNLLVSELYADEGCWNGYPPHKHDEDRGVGETNHEELYHYRFLPENGFGAQYCFAEEGGESTVFMTCQGDTFLLDAGYHPTVTSPGHEEYIFTMLVGKTQRSLVQHFKGEYQYLMEGIPGIAEMRAKFK